MKQADSTTTDCNHNYKLIWLFEVNRRLVDLSLEKLFVRHLIHSRIEDSQLD